MINKARKYLIRLGKVLPFVVSYLIFVFYFECFLALLSYNFLAYDDYVILNTPISFHIGEYFEYNLQMLVVLCIISVAIETCVWNKLACLYLGVNLIEKSYFDYEMDIWQIYVIVVANMLVSAYLTYKGIRIWFKKNHST